MQPPPGWKNPIVAAIGQTQYGVDPLQLLPSRVDLLRWKYDIQRALRLSGAARHTPIQVTTEGVIWDGHHAIRLAAEEGRTVDVLVIAISEKAKASSILSLPLR